MPAFLSPCGVKVQSRNQAKKDSEMDSKAKAALLSIGVIVVLIVGCVIFFMGGTPTPEDPGQAAIPVIDESPVDPVAVVVSRAAVRVQVTAKEDGRELADARLSVVLRKRTVARAQGAALDLELDPGRYEFNVSCRGYTSEDREVVVAEGETQKTLAFVLERGLFISGRILGTDGQPIAGADVSAFRGLADPDADLEETLRAIVDIEKIAQEVGHTAVSGDDGVYRIDGLEPRWYAVRAVAAGFGPAERADVPAPSEKIDLVLDVGATLEGVVVNEDGEPIAGAQVLAKIESEDPQADGVFEVILSKGRPAVDSATSDGSGRFRLERLGAGLYNFKVAATRYRQHVEMAVRLVSGANPAKTFTLQSGRVIKGVVRNEGDEPIAGAEIRLVPYRGLDRAKRFELRFVEPSVTDADGRFEFHSLQDVRHLATIYHPEYRTLANKKALPSDEDIVFVMKVGPRLEGKVTAAESGEPVVGAQITVPDVGEDSRTATTDDKGNYSVGGLTKTQRRLTMAVEAKGFGVTMREFDPRAGELLIEDFSLEAAGTVSGRVLGSEGPARNAAIDVRRVQDEGQMRKVIRETYADGSGRYQLENLDPGILLVLRVQLRKHLDYVSEPFELSPGEVLELDDIKLDLGGEIAGLVVDASGAPLTGCVVEARPKGATDVDKEGTVMKKSGADGKYLLQGLAPGAIDLVFKAKGYVELVREDIEARVGLRNQQDDVVLERASVISGRVVDPDGNGVGGAHVMAWEMIDGVREHRVLTHANGEFSLDTLASEDYVEFKVSHSDYASFEQDKVAVNNEEPFVVEIVPLGRVTGVLVSSADGAVVPDILIELKSPKYDGAKPLVSRRFKDGNFEVRGIRDGVYDIFVRSPGFKLHVERGKRISSRGLLDLGTVKLDRNTPSR